MMENTVSEEKDMTAVPAADIMPTLPDASVPKLTAEDRLVVLLASAAQGRGRLSPEGWKKASEVLESVFAPDADSIVDEAARAEAQHRYFILQTRFHAALLLPPLPAAQFVDDSRIAQDLAAIPEEKAELFKESVHRLAPEYAEAFTVHPEQTEKKLTFREAMSRSMRLIPGMAAWENLFGQKEQSKSDEAQGTSAENSASAMEDIHAAPSTEQIKNRIDVWAEMAAGQVPADTADPTASVAKAEYQGASRYLQELGIQRLFPMLGGSEHGRYALAGEFRDAARAAYELEQAALDSGQMDTARALGDFQHLMAEQPFTVVVVGEGKRGKSSLVNALLGYALSPVRESVPETAAVARFRWGRSFKARIHFLSEEECGGIEEFKRHHAKDSSLAERLQQFFCRKPAQDELDIATEDQLAEFLSAANQAMHGTARAEIQIPAEILRRGMVLVDTPGLNATDPVQNYLAFEE